ncbi:MAG: hypothetical protein GWN39_08145 [Thermoplasmata archaeon]|nr:hypothetical protein [Thermoplasmata archaeon]
MASAEVVPDRANAAAAAMRSNTINLRRGAPMGPRTGSMGPGDIYIPPLFSEAEAEPAPPG